MLNHLRPWARRFMHLGVAVLVAAYIWRVCGGSQSVEMALLPGDGRKPFGREMWLNSFRIEPYPDGSVRSYVSEVSVDKERSEIRVNRPWRNGSYWILQSSWFEAPDFTGGTVIGSVLTAMCDSTWPFALAGFSLLVLGSWMYAVFGLSRQRPKGLPGVVSPSGRLVMSATVLMGAAALVMAVAYTFRTGHLPLADVKGFLLVSAASLPWLAAWGRRVDGRGLGFADLALEAVLLAGAISMKGRMGGLPPALQSPYFIPHVGSYVLGYIVLARAAMTGSALFVPLGFAFITTGMVLGSMWGEICWGAWWSFDPKETWSLVTWLVFASLFHIPRSGRMARAVLWAGFALIVLTLLWVNFSRLFSGLHSYAG